MALASCQPGAARPPLPEVSAVGDAGWSAGWFSRSASAVEPDLDAAQAGTEGVRAVLSRLPDKERRQLLNRWLATVPATAVADTPAPHPTVPLPESLDLLTTVRGLYADQGSRDLALAAFFLGSEPVTRARQRLRLPAEGLSLEKLASRLTARERRALPYVREARDRAILAGLAWPVERDWRLTSPFGSRLHPILGKPREHRGVDISVPEGTVVRAPASGVVLNVRQGPVNGQSVELRHEAGVRTLYCHLSLVEVKPGQKVQAGERLALSGQTGRVTGPHLHYQVQYAGSWLDPVGLRVSADRVAQPLAWPLPPPPPPLRSIPVAPTQARPL